MNDTHACVTPLGAAAEGRLDRVSTTALPDGLGVAASLLVGDVRWTGSPEIVLVCPGRLMIFTLEGRPVVDRVLPAGVGAAGFLSDADADGKLDVFVGTDDAPQPAVWVLNGSGTTIRRLAPASQEASYRRYVPLMRQGPGLLIQTQARWATSPRGLTYYNLHTGETTWTFAIPSDPVGICLHTALDGQAVITVSQYPLYNGQYPFLGPDAKQVYGVDACVHLIRLNLEGKLLAAQPVLVDHKPLLAMAVFHPLVSGPLVSGADEPLLLHEILQQTAPVGTGATEAVPAEQTAALHVVDPRTATVTSSCTPGDPAWYGSGSIGRGIAQIRVLREYRGVGPDGYAAFDPLVVTLVGSPGSWDLSCYDGGLRLVANRRIDAELAALGAVLRSADTTADPPEDDRLFVMADSSLTVLRVGALGFGEGAVTPILPAHWMAFAEWGGRGWIVLAGETLQIYTTAHAAKTARSAGS